MILNRAGNDLRRRSREAVHQHDDRIILAAVAVLRDVALLRRGAAVMRNDELSLLQELVGHANAFAQQSAGIAAQIENQSLQIAELIERFGNFMLGGLVEIR